MLSVSALVWEQGGTEEDAIAGLLHDYILNRATGSNINYRRLHESSIFVD
nr:hypothetical protein [Gloeocapsa sp. PCC 73106]